VLPKHPEMLPKAHNDQDWFSQLGLSVPIRTMIRHVRSPAFRRKRAPQSVQIRPKGGATNLNHIKSGEAVGSLFRSHGFRKHGRFPRRKAPDPWCCPWKGRGNRRWREPIHGIKSRGPENVDQLRNRRESLFSGKIGVDSIRTSISRGILRMVSPEKQNRRPARLRGFSARSADFVDKWWETEFRHAAGSAQCCPRGARSC